jgi:hypothetical protein
LSPLRDGSGRFAFVVERRIVGIAFRAAAVEARTVVAVERRVAAQPLRKVRIGDEQPAEGDRIRTPFGDCRLGGLADETFCRSATIRD